MKKKIMIISYIVIGTACIFLAVQNNQLRHEISQKGETAKVYSQYNSGNDNKIEGEEVEKLKNEIKEVKKEISDKNESIDKERKSYEERISNLYQDIKQNSYVLDAVNKEQDNFDILSMNTVYVNDRIMTSFAKHYEIIPKNLDLESKLNIIADYLSENFFEGNIIKVEEIKEIEGNKIAFINLIDKEENHNWSKNYFQGSTGGLITTSELLSFLQPQYKGQWIDGVKFLYNDKDIEFQHVPELNETIYRKDKIESVEKYFPSNRKVLKYSGGFENAGYTKTIEEIENGKVLINHKDTAIENYEVYEVTSDYIKLVYSSGESYDKNKDYLKEKPNRDSILLKGPIKIGTTWNNGKSIITGINILVQTAKGAYNTVEVTNYEENYTSKIYFAQDVGIVKRIYKPSDGKEMIDELIESK